MTRKDFEAIARILDANTADYCIVADFADFLSEENPRFDRERFVEASTQELRKTLSHTARMLDLIAKK